MEQHGLENSFAEGLSFGGDETGREGIADYRRGGGLGGVRGALDPVSGKSLWETQLAPGGVGTPISYELDGKQYIAVMAGIAKGRVYAFALDAK